jgi:hypothetical protein
MSLYSSLKIALLDLSYYIKIKLNISGISKSSSPIKIRIMWPSEATCLCGVSVIRENQKSNQEWTIQRHRRHTRHTTKKNKPQKTKQMYNKDQLKKYIYLKQWQSPKGFLHRPIQRCTWYNIVWYFSNILNRIGIRIMWPSEATCLCGVSVS